MTIENVLWAFLALAAGLVAYHHAAYPLILRFIGARQGGSVPVQRHPEFLPRVTIIVPAYRERDYIARKIEDLAALDYPVEALEIMIACDGSPDGTPEVARDALDALGEAARHIQLDVFPENRGKVTILNAMIGKATGEIVVLMDASAGNSPDFVRRLVQPFSDQSLGVACAGYKLDNPGSPGEAAYWQYQIAVKRLEAAVAAPMGAHGAAYAFRRNLWKPLPDETINDDFVLPMRMVAEGARAIYRPDIRVSEREKSRPEQDFARRRRLGAGNLQQTWLCRGLASAANPALAFVFLSSKALRAVMPFILAGLLLASAALALTGTGITAWIPLAIHALFYGAALLGWKLPVLRKARFVAYPHYFTAGYLAAFLGALDLVRGRYRDERRSASAGPAPEALFVDPMTAVLKRAFDILVGLVALMAFIVLIVPLALAISLDSKGPIFYRQLRVGRALPDRTELFYLIKLRTMRVDAESASGAVWAAKGDPRVTRLGRFLRKTRLDELPQCINVLRGEMSIVGPRPERPVFFTKLEAAIPFYSERTYGLKPGVTGLAQVSTGYDATIDDVRLKILFDHTYALRIHSPISWLKTDLGIVFKTIRVMGLGMGR